MGFPFLFKRNRSEVSTVPDVVTPKPDGIVDRFVDAVRTPLVPLPAAAPPAAAAPAAAPAPASKPFFGAGTKVTTKHVYDCAKGELKSRTEIRLPNTGARVGLNYSDRASLVSVDVERGAYRLGYDLTREDVLAQVKRKTGAGTITVRQLVPGLRWAVVPSPVVEVATRLLDTGRGGGGGGGGGGGLRDSLKLVYDFSARQAFYTETLKAAGGRVKLRVAGDSKTGDHAFCAGFKPGGRWLKSLKVVHTPQAGPVLSYKLRPFPGCKVAAEAAARQRVASASLAFKALKGDAEVVLDAAVPYGEGLVEGLRSARVLRRAGLKCDFAF